jgi:PAS domain S-box-containing protein
MWTDVILSPLTQAGEVKYAVATVRDLTEIEARQKEYRLLRQNTTDGVFVCRDEKIWAPNPKILEMTGYSCDELSGMGFLELFHPEDTKKLEAGHSGYLAEQEPLRVVAPGGEISWVYLKRIPVTLEGRPATLNILRDITEQFKLAERLGRTQKIEAVGILAGGIVHEFNNILSSVTLHSEMAKEISGGDKMTRHMDAVLRATDRAARLTDQMLRFSRQEEQERGVLKLKPIIKEGLKLLRASLPTTVEIQQDIKDNLLPVIADPVQIHQILINLCSNAANSVQTKGGVMKVGLDEVVLESSGRDGSPDLPPGPYVRFWVTDNGPGMPPAGLEKIFDPEFTPEANDKNMGMRLAVTKDIVKNHGGQITVESSPGQGINFEVLLPAVIEESRDALEPVDDAPGGNERLIFVDDDEMLAHAVSFTLERLGYEAHCFTSSRDALEAFRNNPENYDLIITDQTMPAMTGAELSREILRLRPGIPIILCTDYRDILDKDQARKMGIHEFVMKPLTTHIIARTIRGVLAGGG